MITALLAREKTNKQKNQSNFRSIKETKTKLCSGRAQSGPMEVGPVLLYSSTILVQLFFSKNHLHECILKCATLQTKQLPRGLNAGQQALPQQSRCQPLTVSPCPGQNGGPRSGQTQLNSF
jgi:hypothetical protein